MTSSQKSCRYANGFALWEKLWAQGSFFAMLILGTIGIAREDWPWLAPYLAAGWYGVPGIIMRHVICPRCPHLYVYNDCLQFPPKLTKWLIPRRRTAPLSTLERAAFWAILLMVPLYPLYWLRSETVLLWTFVASAAMWYSGQWFYFCKRCRLRNCPLNRVPAGAMPAASDGARTIRQ
jgi:hypothetical protein